MRQKESGASTAEFAMLLPTVVLVIALALNVVAIGIQYVRLEEAAAATAREAARGENSATLAATARRMAGDSARVTQRTSGGAENRWVSVTVSAPAPGAGGWLNLWTLTAEGHAPASLTAPMGAP